MTRIRTSCIPMPALVLLLTLFSLPLVAQTASDAKLRFAVAGQAVDAESGKNIEYATVSVTHPDSTRSVSAADGNGKFRIALPAEGTYLLTVSSVGYASRTDTLTLTRDRPVADVEKFALTQGADIAEVVVRAQKPLVTVDADKLTYSVEADPDAPTSTLVDILRKVPQLEVDAEDNVTLNGQSNFKVLVNGKTSTMFARNLKDVIRSMPAGSIKDIQVITNPSTKYDAEGAGGIINIITNRKTLNGYSGRISGGASSFGSYNGNGYLSAKLGKFNLSTNFWSGRYGAPEFSGVARQETWDPQTGELVETSDYSGSQKGHNISQNYNFEGSYEIDTFNLVTLSFNYYNGHYKYHSLQSSLFRDNTDAVIREYTQDNNGKYTWSGVATSFDYQRTFAKADKTFTGSYKLDRNPNGYDYLSDVRNITGWDQYRKKRSGNDEWSTEHTLQLDYYDPVTKKHQIEVGLKYILRINSNESYAEKLIDEDGIWEDEPFDANDLDYRQHIFAAYGGYLYKLKKITAKAGYRAEGTATDATVSLSGGDESFDNRQFNLIPYVNFSYLFKPTQRFTVSYTQRLNRPGIDRLNPYRDTENPYVTSSGNPNLESVVNNSFNVNYSYFGKSTNLSAGVTASFTNNPITSLTTVEASPDDPNVSIHHTTYYNLGREQSFNSNLSYTYRYKTRFRITASMSGNYSVVEAKEKGLRNEGFRWNGNLNTQVGLWKEANFRANGGFRSRSINLQGTSGGYYYYSFGLSQQLLKKKLDLNGSISNLFHPYMTHRSTTEIPTIRGWNETRYQQRRWNISVGYRFGKMDVQVRKARRTISNDDKMASPQGEGGGATSTPN